jgi:hypothetical protein
LVQQISTQFFRVLCFKFIRITPSVVVVSKKGDIGFLNKENRICVALSRARKGFYILGNMDTLTHKSRHWETIHQKLKREDKKYSEAHCGVQRSFIGKELLLYSIFPRI